MSQYGTQWKPCERINGKIMMRLNPDPVVFDLETLVENLSYRASSCYFEIDEFLMMTKKEIKDAIRQLANYMSYNWEGHEIYEFHDEDDDEVWEECKNKVRAKILKVFPEFQANEEE